MCPSPSLQDVISERAPGMGGAQGDGVGILQGSGRGEGGGGSGGGGGGGGSRAKLEGHAPPRSAVVVDSWEADAGVVDNDGKGLQSIDI